MSREDKLPGCGIRYEMGLGSYRLMSSRGSLGSVCQGKEAGVDFLGMDGLNLTG